MLRTFFERTLIWTAAMFLRGLSATLRWEFQSADGDAKNFFRDLKTPHIIAFWHAEQLLMTFSVMRTGAPPRSFAVLISQHSDGRLIADVIDRIGMDSVAGSSTRGGSEATRGLLRVLKSGKHIALTPDGPKGPRQICKKGVIVLARLSGVPIIPISCRFSHKWVFGSWDRMELPKPFAKAYATYGAPIVVSRDADEDEMEAKRLEVESALNALGGLHHTLAKSAVRESRSNGHAGLGNVGGASH